VGGFTDRVDACNLGYLFAFSVWTLKPTFTPLLCQGGYVFVSVCLVAGLYYTDFYEIRE